MKKRILSFCCCVLGLGTATLFAQQGVVPAGGNASGAGGTVSYSIGQIFSATNSGTTHSIIQGLQQPFEISIVGLDETSSDISLNALVYPIPVTDWLTLKIKNTNFQNLSYGLYDVNGRLISQGDVKGEETEIDASALVTSCYFLRVFDSNQIIKTFKILKSY